MRRAQGLVEQLQAAVDTWGIGVFEWDHVEARVSGSASFFALYDQLPPGPIAADCLWAAVHPADRSLTRAAFEQALDPASGGRIDVMHRVLHADGKLIWVHVRAQTRFAPRQDSRRCADSPPPEQAPPERESVDAWPCSTVGSVVDVTERKRIEEQLRHTEARFDEAVRSAQFGIFEHNHIDDPRAENCYWSPRLREIFGVDEQVPGSAAWLIERIHPNDIERLHGEVARAHDPNGSGYYDVEHRYMHPSLGLRWLLTRSSTYFGDVDGKRVPVRTVGAMLDVTARHKSEQEHEQRAQILDATIDFVAIAQPDGTLIYLNRAARKFLGIGADEPLSALSLKAVHPAESLRRVWSEGIPTAAREGAWQGETEFLRHDGSVVPMSQVLLSHCGRDGQPVLFSTIARDLSRERQLEQNMRQAQKMEAVGRLAGGIAHDFNNILTAILSFAYVASDDVGTAGKGYAELQEIIAAGKRAAALTQQLLAFSRKQVLQPRVVDVGELLTSMGPMLQRLVGEDIEFVLSLERAALRVKVDPTHLEQVLLNLVVNARDALDSGGRLTMQCQMVQVGATRLSAHAGLEPGRYVVIAVSDNGVGMDAETRTHVFEPFFTTKAAGRGTGLGLATVFGIVKQSGGNIYVDSEVGRGSTFWAYFPSSLEPLTQPGPEPQLGLDSRGGVVLVAEDDPAVRNVVVTVLKRAGYSVLDAAGPIEALKLARGYKGRVDLLLTDIVMPQLSGMDLAERLTALWPKLSVVYMSGYTDRDITRLDRLGSQFLPKPITPVRLLDAIARVLNEAQARPADGWELEARRGDAPMRDQWSRPPVP